MMDDLRQQKALLQEQLANLKVCGKFRFWGGGEDFTVLPDFMTSFPNTPMIYNFSLTDFFSKERP